MTTPARPPERGPVESFLSDLLDTPLAWEAIGELVVLLLSLFSH